MQNEKELDIIINLIKEECKKYQNAIVTEIADLTKSPFKVLISCLLSLRTKDAVTAKASKRLFEIADTPEKLAKLTTEKIEELIYPVGFYKRKAENLKKISKILIEKYKSQVPNNEEELLKLKGVGRKTMNIVMTYAFNSKNHIAVDSHVHQIAKRLNWVTTKTPEETEREIKKKIPQKYWYDLNDLLVVFGQNICVPVSPFCSKCPIEKYCPKKGIKNQR